MATDEIRFVKMHGAGNDYVYIDAGRYPIADPNALALALADRHFGVGSDGLILILPSEKADFRMRMFNSDGREGAMCGNGARCVGRFVYEQGLTDKPSVSLETDGGIRQIELDIDGGALRSVRVDMGAPQAYARGEGWTFVSMGSLHRVYQVPDDPFAWTGFDERAAPICAEADANIEYVQVLSPNRLRMRVYERGSGETLACGSGACATMVAMHAEGQCGPEAAVEMRGGTLMIRQAQDGHIWMEGPSVTVFEGTLHPDWLEESYGKGIRNI